MRRVPVLLQATATECGAACLAMILSYHGRPTTIASLRPRFGAGRDGIRARAIVEVARELGLTVRAFSSDLARFRELRLPAIVHWNFNHFVLVERWTGRRAWIVDPAFGRRSVSRAEFEKSYTGVAITFEPGPAFERSRAPEGALGAFLRHVLAAPGVRGLAVQALLASLLLQILGLALPAFTKVMVDHVLPLRLGDALSILGAGMLLIILAQIVTSYIRSALLIHLQARFDERVMLGLFEHLLKLPFAFFQQRTSGDLLTRLSSTGTLREVLTNQTLSMLLDGPLVLVYLAILLAQAPSLGLVALAAGALQVLLLVSTAERVRDLTQRHLVADAESQSFTVQALRGITAFKAAAAEELAFTYWSSLFFKQLHVAVQRSHVSALVGAGLGAARALAPLALLWVGAREVLEGSMRVGSMLALTAVAGAFLAPLAHLVATAQQLQLAALHLDRITDIVHAEPEQLGAGRDTPRLEGRIDLENVSFRYDPRSPNVLSDISVSIAPGEKVALVGRTGSGKSTLGLLLLGLYPPAAGRILYDGIPLSELDLRKVRSQLGVVLQEPFLIGGAVRQNVSLNDASMPLDRVVEAVRAAAMEDEVRAMPMQYDTWIGEGGAGLSGGQRQRLSLARALASRPAVLLLDEATSHLDARTEAIVDANLSALACTRIVIAHRLSTIRSADQILVIEGGRIVERGTHEELLARGAHYAALVRGQAEADERAPETPASGDHRKDFNANASLIA